MVNTTRREFIELLGVLLATSALGEDKPARLPIAFSTLGCPAWSLAKILDFAEAQKFSAVELRGLEGNLDLPSHPAFSAEHIAQTKGDIRAHGLKIASVSTS